MVLIFYCISFIKFLSAKPDMAKRQGSQLTLTGFLVSSKKAYTNNDLELREQHTDSAPVSFNSTGKISLETNVEPTTTATDDVNILDLGKYLGAISNIDRETKLKLLTSPWVPGDNYGFPASGKRNLKFQRQWLSRFKWLVYTNMDGALCKYCVLFSKDTGGKGGHQKLKTLVKEPYKNWKDALEVFKIHENHAYHKECMISGTDFLRVSKDTHRDIRNILDSTRQKLVQENRDRLFSIVETIKLCGRQDLALRGTNDSGPISVNDTEPLINDGNFRAILRMRMQCGDQKLIKHTQTISLNAIYMSPTIQNDIINICGEIIQQQIVNDIIEAKVFSILVDETADIAGQEQLSLCVRYTIKDESCYASKEDFLGFVRLEHTTGEHIAKTIMSFLHKLGVNSKNMVGQGYDGASVMKGSFKGVQAHIRQDCPQALYVHCCSHSLNLALCHSCKLQSVRNCVGTVKSIITFLKGSPKRMGILRKKIALILPECHTSTLTSTCETRWVENHKSLLKFKEIFKPILETLEELSDDLDVDTSSKASSFVRATINGEFVVSLCFIAKVFSYTLTLCKALQSPLCDLKSAIDHVQNIVDLFENMRTDIESVFCNIYKSAKTIIEDVGEEIKIPRRTSSQRHRCNVEANDPEKYFRVAIAIPLIDDFIQQLKDRFLDHKEVFTSLYSLLPSVCCDPTVSLDIQNLKMYEEKVDLELLEAEFELWKLYWSKKDESDRPTCAIESLGECNEEFYPNIFILLNIFSTLPVTTCSAERTFSTLRRLKTYLRNSCGQDRLSGLALMSTHRNRNISTDKVIDIFASKQDRKLNLIL